MVKRVKTVENILDLSKRDTWKKLKERKGYIYQFHIGCLIP